MSRWSLWFVAAIFIALGASFILSTGTIFREFGGEERVALLAAHSHLFVFFPTLGIVALAAFYIPAAIFTDLYFTGKARFGLLRFFAGFVAAILLSLASAGYVNSDGKRSVWELSPKALDADLKRGVVCDPNNRDHCTQPITRVLQDLRAKALERVHISPFARQCRVDELLEPNPVLAYDRYCFPAQTKLNAEACCKVQKAFFFRVAGAQRRLEDISVAASLDAWFLPAKCFFIIIMVVIGALLIVWKKTLQENYEPYLKSMDRGLQIGGAAMVLWPIMDYAYQQTTDVLYGPEDSFPLRLSLVLVPWGLLLASHFFAKRLGHSIRRVARPGSAQLAGDQATSDNSGKELTFAQRHGIDVTRMLQVAGSVVSVAAVLRYDILSDWSSKLVGLGANIINFWLLVGLSVVVTFLLIRWIRFAIRLDSNPPSRGNHRQYAGPLT